MSWCVATSTRHPTIIESRLIDLADVLLLDVTAKDLPAQSQAQVRNMTAEIFVVQQKHVNVTMSFVGPDNSSHGMPVTGPTTDHGDFAGWLSLSNGQNLGDLPMNTSVHTLEIHAKGTDSGNATAYLVPPDGITIVPEIDDVLRVTRGWSSVEGLLNLFARPFTSWLNMPDILAGWARMPGAHFHYITATPGQVERNYMAFTFATYPPGSFDSPPLNFFDVNNLLPIRKHLIERLLETSPRRKFVLIADTSNPDVMGAYP